MHTGDVELSTSPPMLSSISGEDFGTCCIIVGSITQWTCMLSGEPLQNEPEDDRRNRITNQRSLEDCDSVSHSTTKSSSSSRQRQRGGRTRGNIANVGLRQRYCRVRQLEEVITREANTDTATEAIATWMATRPQGNHAYLKTKKKSLFTVCWISASTQMHSKLSKWQ
jgi:hypothetical protein